MAAYCPRLANSVDHRRHAAVVRSTAPVVSRFTFPGTERIRNLNVRCFVLVE